MDIITRYRQSLRTPLMRGLYRNVYRETAFAGAIDEEAALRPALSSGGYEVQILHPFKHYCEFSKIAILEPNKKTKWRDVYVKTEDDFKAITQLVGHTVLEAVGLPVARIYVAFINEWYGCKTYDVFSEKTFAHPVCFNPKSDEDTESCIAYLRQHPRVAAEMLCSEIITDMMDDCVGQMVYNKDNPEQAYRVDVMASGGFGENFRYEKSSNFDPLVHCREKTFEEAFENAFDFFAIKAQRADPQAVLDIMKRAERILTDDKLNQLFAKTMHEGYVRDALPDIRRNVDNWRTILAINSPELAQQVAALETKPGCSRVRVKQKRFAID